MGEFGGHGNVAAILTAILATLATRGIDGRPLNPWHYPTAEAFAALLEQHGFDVDEAVLVPRPTPLDAGMAAWIEMFGGAFLAALLRIAIASGLPKTWQTCWRRLCGTPKDIGPLTTCGYASWPRREISAMTIDE